MSQVRIEMVPRGPFDLETEATHLHDDPIPQLRPSTGILMRGAGVVDAVTEDDLTPRAIQLLYELPQRPDRAAVLKRPEAWRPYGMWAVVLLNVWGRSQPPDVCGPRQVRSRRK